METRGVSRASTTSTEAPWSFHEVPKCPWRLSWASVETSMKDRGVPQPFRGVPWTPMEISAEKPNSAAAPRFHAHDPITMKLEGAVLTVNLTVSSGGTRFKMRCDHDTIIMIDRKHVMIGSWH